ncbi:RNA-binding S4 domain-containing protein [Altererythrobacter sp. RZ02]|uniref:RNA-binding S4 domain-containing protein n=1 Tax=Pontixanthobacter rizhaonensis TaxID=2730337 RepID=A0A848QRB5_9SPHN|nr:RNA-binding S4 domain-containing protein [Pontixanthobacter rizhaonensis]
MRIDRLLCYLRFVRTRSQAQVLIESGHLRCTNIRVTRTSHTVAIGDVLTFPIGKTVRIVRILTLPDRRRSAAEARLCYDDLDPGAENAIANSNTRSN